MVEEKKSDNTQTVKENGAEEKKSKKGWLGCLVIIGVIIVLVVIGSFFSEPTVEISGDTANLTVTLNPLYNLELCALRVAEEIYDVAKKNENVKKINVTVMVSASGLEDKYGNPLKEDLIMGTIVKDDLEEIRKYKDASSYAYNKASKLSYKVLLNRMNHSHLLKE